jgi:hypothetical protein
MPVQTGSSPLDPVPVGKTVAGIIECGSGYTSHELYDMKITVLEVVRGEEAWKLIKEASASNKPVPAGYGYVLARIRFEYYARGTPGLCIHELRPGQFMACSAEGNDYKAPSVTPPKPEMRRSLRSGESWEGWVAFSVAQHDNKPLMSYSADAGGAVLHGGGKWFALY